MKSHAMVSGVSVERLAAQYPCLFHMAAEGSLAGILKHGLLSTSALLGLHRIEGDERYRIESCHRPTSYVLEDKGLGAAVIRDQKPMDDKGLVRALGGTMTPREWYRTLNSKVFFWVTKERLLTLLCARAYRDKYHDVLVLDTASLVGSNVRNVRLTGMNTGATKPMPFPRGPSTFLCLDQFPFEERLRTKRRSAVVEVAVEGGVMGIEDHLLGAYRVRGEGKWVDLWSAGST